MMPECLTCHQHAPPHDHPDFGLEHVPVSMYSRAVARPMTVTCNVCGYGFETGTKLRDLENHLRSHLKLPENRSLDVPVLPVKQRAEGEEETMPKKEKSKSETKTKADKPKKAPASKTPKEPKVYNPEDRIYKPRSNPEMTTVWVHAIPKDVSKAVMDREKFGESFADWCRKQ
jgi:hypothetical protein